MTDPQMPEGGMQTFPTDLDKKLVGILSDFADHARGTKLDSCEYALWPTIRKVYSAFIDFYPSTHVILTGEEKGDLKEIPPQG